MFGWPDRPTKAAVAHYIGGENPAAVFSIGQYEVTVPGIKPDPEGETPAVTYLVPHYRHNHGDPRTTFPNMEIRDGEMRLPLEDIVGAILARVEPAEIARTLWCNDEVKAAFMEAMAERYESGLDERDRRKFIASVKDAVHDAALDKLAGAMAGLEYAIAKNYYLRSEIEAINQTLAHYEVTRPPRGDETEPQPLRIKDENQVGEFKIGGKAWHEARNYWRTEVGRQFPQPVTIVDEPATDEVIS